MNTALIPRYLFRKYSDISPEFLKERGVNFLMLDLDNTLAMYNESEPSPSAIKWVNNMYENDISLFFVSNSKREDRVESFSQALNIPFIKEAKKPSPNGLLIAMGRASYMQEESAFLGDQIYTDTLAANRAEVISILVRPLSLKNPLLFLRYLTEIPIRALCPNKSLRPRRNNP
ncbi:MAG: YqeG family HAD IIIA-type phosphatase [Oscillospiraceae bacterium]|nr:YqeG family HAD IIIA-type phosphatase [Oscillospiraceae bacterium]